MAISATLPVLRLPPRRSEYRGHPHASNAPLHRGGGGRWWSHWLGVPDNYPQRRARRLVALRALLGPLFPVTALLSILIGPVREYSASIKIFSKRRGHGPGIVPVRATYGTYVLLGT